MSIYVIIYMLCACLYVNEGICHFKYLRAVYEKRGEHVVMEQDFKYPLWKHLNDISACHIGISVKYEIREVKRVAKSDMIIQNDCYVHPIFGKRM